MHKDNTSDPLDHMSIARMKAVHDYLEERHPYMAEDSLVLMTDGHDMIFQLPQEHLLQRYAAMNNNRPAGKEFVIAAADKGKYSCILGLYAQAEPAHENACFPGCHPNWRTEIEVCDAAPVRSRWPSLVVRGQSKIVICRVGITTTVQHVWNRHWRVPGQAYTSSMDERRHGSRNSQKNAILLCYAPSDAGQINMGQ